jgi:hypothetical protein
MGADFEIDAKGERGGDPALSVASMMARWAVPRGTRKIWGGAVMGSRGGLRDWRHCLHPRGERA